MAESTKRLKRNKGDSPIPWEDKKVRGDDIFGGTYAAQSTRGDDIVTRSAEPNVTSRTKSGLTTYPKPTTIKKDHSRLKPGWDKDY